MDCFIYIDFYLIINPKLEILNDSKKSNIFRQIKRYYIDFVYLLFYIR